MGLLFSIALRRFWVVWLSQDPDVIYYAAVRLFHTAKQEID